MKVTKKYLMKLLAIPQLGAPLTGVDIRPKGLLSMKDKKLTEVQEYIMREEAPEMWVQMYLTTLIPELQIDEVGNLYLMNPDTPLICAHMDNVGNASERDLAKIQVFEGDRVQGKGVIGCDDKCGIAAALRLRDIYKDEKGISLLFTTQEETGSNGAAWFVKYHREELEKCTYAIIPDRMGTSDFIGSKNNYCTEEFENKALEWLGIYGFESARGVYCDCDKLNEVLNTVNISIGYMGHHTKTEHCFLSQMTNTIAGLRYLIDNFNEKLPTPEPEVMGSTYARYNLGSYNRFGEFIEPKKLPYIEQMYDDDLYVSDDMTIENIDSGKTYTIPKGDYIIKSGDDDIDNYIDYPMI